MKLKKGYQTSEFWLTSAAHLVTILLLSGVFPAASIWVQVAAFVQSALAQLGYTVGRTSQKLQSTQVTAVLKAKEMDQ